MAGIGSGYDLSVTTFSPDGRVFQVEYAQKAAGNSSTTFALVCQDGILFATEKFILTNLTVPGTSPRIFAVAKHCGISVAGFNADSREVVRRARLEAKEYKKVYDEDIPARILAERIALFFHTNTVAWSERPLGCSILLGVAEPLPKYTKEIQDDPMTSEKMTHRFCLYSIDTAGTCYKYFATALGKGKQIAKNEIEKLKLSELTCEEAMKTAIRIMCKVHEDSQERDMEIELAYICKKSNYQFEMISPTIVNDLFTQVKSEIEEEEYKDDVQKTQ